MSGDVVEPTVILLLGGRTTPTDGVYDYCVALSAALERRDQRAATVLLPWKEVGRVPAIVSLWRASRPWARRWVLVQYTALTWSRRGFPFLFLLVLGVLRARGARIGVVFHDSGGHHGPRVVQWIRRAGQDWIMRRAYAASERSVLTVPLERVLWLPRHPARAVFIVVGPNIPATHPATSDESRPAAPRHRVAGTGQGPRKKIVVFGITGGRCTQPEVDDIAFVLRHAAQDIPHLELVVLGAGSGDASAALHAALEDVGVSVSVLGVVSAPEVARALGDADVFLFVRGGISSGRSSAIAAIAAGTPIVAYAGPATAPPITEAGILLAPERDRAALCSALSRLLSDDDLWHALRRRNLEVYRRHFSWDAIAGRFVSEVTGG